MKLYNTTTRQIEDFVPIKSGEAGIYACGPTVYHYAHIGNMRTYVFEDILRRVLEHSGYKVNHVMNITDVGHLQSDADSGDDKMSLAAKREQKSPWDIAKYYEEAFFKHADMLGILRPHIVCRATDHIQEMIEMVQTLQNNGYAYEVDGNVYFDVAKFPEYADFADLNMEEQKATDRVDFDTRKRNQADFVLWFSNSKFPNQIMQWESPWGTGFPGWHIECSAMASKYLGNRIDIHCGGIDHIPVHHTNEIAQSECCHGHKWVNYWLHGAFINMGSDKMSKSKGNVLTVDTLIEEGFHPLAYRYFLLSSHYRSEIKFDFKLLQSAQTAYNSLYEKIQEWLQQDHLATTNADEASANGYLTQFLEQVRNDLHTPSALQTLWAVVNDKALSTPAKLGLIERFDEILGLKLLEQQGEGRALSDEEESLLSARIQARANKNWAESDRLRDVLMNEHHIKVKDTSEGQEWVRTR